MTNLLKFSDFGPDSGGRMKVRSVIFNVFKQCRINLFSRELLKLSQLFMEMSLEHLGRNEKRMDIHISGLFM